MIQKEILALHAGCDECYSWLLNEGQYIEIGDFAIVENRDELGLVRVIGIIEVDAAYSRTKKKVVMRLERHSVLNAWEKSLRKFVNDPFEEDNDD